MDELCRQLFGRAWASLSLDDIERFLREIEEEGLTWEATGGQENASKVRKEVCAFANSERGGYLLLGVGGDVRSGWTPDGIAFKAAEPAQWVGQVVSSGLRPRPAFDARPFEVADRRVLVVVQVPPVTEPPCITSGGAVYERVTGESVPVKDPARLADLFAAGNGARARAEAGATSASEEMATPPVPLEPSSMHEYRFAFGMRAMGYPDDIGSRLFTEDFDGILTRAFAEELLPGGWPDLEYRQDRTRAVMVFTDQRFGRSGWSIHGGWDGSVGAFYTDGASERNVEDVVTRQVQPAWRAGAALVRGLGGSGAIHVSISLAQNETVTNGPTHPVHLQRVAEMAPPGQIELKSVSRELMRAGGERAHEPGRAPTGR